MDATAASPMAAAAAAAAASADDHIKVACVRDTDIVKLYSNGLIQGDDPFFYSIPVVIFQIFAVSVLSKALYLLLRRYNQPRIICDLISGVMLGPTFLRGWGWYESQFLDVAKNAVATRIIAFYGIIYYIFVIGVKMDPAMALRSGRKAFVIAGGSVGVPIALAGGIAYYLEGKRLASSQLLREQGKYLYFLSASIGVTNFPVLAEILSELELLNSELGRMAMSAAIIQDFVAWLCMALFAGVMQSTSSDSGKGGDVGWSSNGSYAFASLVAVVLLSVYVFRPAMVSLVRRTPKGGRVPDAYVFAIVLLVTASAVLTDAIGAMFITGPLIVGMCVPEGPPLGTALVGAVETFSTEVAMPLFFVVVGQVVDLRGLVNKPVGEWFWPYLLPLVALVFIGTIMGTMAFAMHCMIPGNQAFILGLIMNFKGLMEVIIYFNLYTTHILDEDSLSVLIVLAAVSTAISAPSLKRLYNPLGGGQGARRRAVQTLRPHSELRLVVGVHNESAVPAILAALEAFAADGFPMCSYVLHMVELSGRSNSALIVHKNKKGFVNPADMDPIMNAFIQYELQKKGDVAVLPFTAMAPYKTMHHDVLMLSNERNAAMIVVPFPKKGRGRRRGGVGGAGPGAGGGGATGAGAADLDHMVRGVIDQILAHSMCSVGILVYEAFGLDVMPTPGQYRLGVGMLFWGGSDDREALACAYRMAMHAGVTLTVVRFRPAGGNTGGGGGGDGRYDEQMLSQLAAGAAGLDHVQVEEAAVKDVEESIAVLREVDARGFDLLVVGRRQGAVSYLDEGMSEWSEFAQLGVIGDMLASSDFVGNYSILVVQKHS